MTNLVVPALGESITEATVSRWLKKVGEAVSADEPLVDLETDKVTVQLPAPEDGVLSEQTVAEGETVTVGQIIGLFKPGGVGQPAKTGNGASSTAAMPAQPARVAPAPAPTAAPAAPAAAAPPRPVSGEAAPPSGGPARALSPSMRKAVRERGPQPVADQGAPAPAAMVRPAPTPATAEEVEDVIPMSSLRKRIAERLVMAQQTAAILTTFNEVDMTAVMALRAAHKDDFAEAHGVKLGFMSFFVKACVAALRLFPGLNAEIRDDAIAYKKYYNIGVAVGGGKGLVVPVLRHSDQMSFAEIERTIVELAGKARTNTLALSDLSGGTFTITNGGIYGSMMSTPLLNFPQTGILGMHNIVNRPMAIGDRVEVRPMMYLALSYDHRVVDGREAVRFLVAIKERIEHPDKLLLEL
jgi:2-oxoglutarate dehydrogenase E2 component (dihydrolipoamide succinyltransferase)